MRAGIVKTSAAAVLALAAVALSFELGRYRAGFSRFDADRREQALEAGIEAREQALDGLERQVAILETSRGIDRETYLSVEATLAELEARIQAQEEELAFYRGIVSPADGLAGLKIQNVEIVPGEAGATHTLKVLLVQAIVHNDELTGSLRARLAGTLDGAAADFGLEDLRAEGRGAEIPYGFRYFQTLEMGLALPPGFEPGSVEIQLWPASPRGETIRQDFPWPADADQG